MSAVLKVVDRQLGQEPQPGFELRLASERITARQLIQRRVADEVAAANEKRNSISSAQVQARQFLLGFGTSAVEAKLNGPGVFRKPKLLDEEEEVSAALGAFEANAFIMLFDDQQIDDLDQELTVTPASEAVFLRMVPLIGG